MTDTPVDPQAPLQMEGTWGRRVWGKVQKGRTSTRFYLVYDVREDIIVVRDALIDHADLEYKADLYGQTLNAMVDSMQAEVSSYDIATPAPVVPDPAPEPVTPDPVVEPTTTRPIEQPEPYLLPTDVPQ